MSLVREWFSAVELAAEKLPELPGSVSKLSERAKREGWDRSTLARKRAGRGGGVEYHYTLLPEAAQAVLVTRHAARAPEKALTVARATRPRAGSEESWAWFEAQPETRKAEAQRRVRLIARIEALTTAHGRVLATEMVAEEAGVSASTLRNWLSSCVGVAKSDRLTALMPLPRGGKKSLLQIDERAWDYIRADYLRLSQPSFESCYRRLERVCIKEGWEVPPERTLRRRVDAIPAPVRVLARQGAEAAKRLYPPQERDRTCFHALEAVNADGHKWDVFVRWDDGKISRPIMLAFQDLYSGKILSWRYGRSESKDLVRLAFGDLIMSFGIPDKVWLDNGRAFASKWITGGTVNRYRFKVRPEEPDGIMTQLGVEVHWATPYHGQAKPIERAFGDLARDVARDPRFQGAYVGNSPLAKPEDYGTRAIPFEQFAAIVDHEIMMHNQRPGRRSLVCGGKLSFNQAFDQSYAVSPIRRAAEEQVRICLLAAENVSTHRETGAVTLLGNRYWAPELVQVRGEKVMVRFDPDRVQQDLGVFRLDGSLICIAQLWEAVGFADTTAAREHAQARNKYLRALRDQRDAERTMGLDQVADLLGSGGDAAPARAKPRKLANGNLALKADEPEDDFDEQFAAGLRLVRAAQQDL